mmetsp:Transcript_48374/g.103697  ORF Transcript_48374/g.103697 Transcript_48374/m.103697 type:complete len:376 (+) Transcript_48374:109-1236(+)
MPDSGDFDASDAEERALLFDGESAARDLMSQSRAGAFSRLTALHGSIGLGRARRRRMALGAFLTACVVAALALAGLGQRSRSDAEANSQRLRGDVKSSVGLQIESMLSTIAGSLSATMKGVEGATDLEKASKGKFGTDLEDKLWASGWNLTNGTNLTDVGANRTDGNQCADDEELFGSLCYKRCGLLHEGYGVRTSAFSCCKAEPCGVFNSRLTSMFNPCGGNAVGGDIMGGGCPHSVGSCLANEEASMGACYLKCGILTNGTYPFRQSDITCCKYREKWPCLDTNNTLTSVDFNIAGGAGDGLESTPGSAHTPMPELAEAQTTTTLWTPPPTEPPSTLEPWIPPPPPEGPLPILLEPTTTAWNPTVPSQHQPQV